MFDNRRWNVWRSFDPPRPIYVDIDRLLPAEVPPNCDVPQSVQKYGLPLSGRMPAELRAWHRLVDGRWIASLHVPVEVDGGWIFLDFFAPADAVAPREDGAAFPARPTDRWGRPLRF